MSKNEIKGRKIPPIRFIFLEIIMPHPVQTLSKGLVRPALHSKKNLFAIFLFVVPTLR
jgi:hypothetical protein